MAVPAYRARLTWGEGGEGLGWPGGMAGVWGLQLPTLGRTGCFTHSFPHGILTVRTSRRP